MKKYKDIRIIKENSSSSSSNYDNNYTFIDNINTSKTNGLSSTNIKDKVNGEDTLRTTIDDKKEEKYKKKKVANKAESKSKFNKALRFSNPSQRNHSSVYE